MITPDEQKLINRVQAWNPIDKARKSDNDKSFTNPFSTDYDATRAYELSMKSHVLRREFDPSYRFHHSRELPVPLIKHQTRLGIVGSLLLGAA